MIDLKSSKTKFLVASAMLLAVGCGLGACTTQDQASEQVAPRTTSNSSTPTQPTQDLTTASDSTTPSGSPTAKTQGIALQVTGAKSQGLVKTLVVTSAGKKEGGKMTSQSLPLEETIELAAGERITKILVLAKYPDGQTGEIACGIFIDDKQVSTDASTNHKPAKCLVTNP
ncbi:hypothetical protein [Glutamicibacter protophormiae]